MQLGTYFVSFKFAVDLFHASSWEPAPPFRQLRASPVAWSVAKNLAVCTAAKLNLQDRALGQVGKKS